MLQCPRILRERIFGCICPAGEASTDEIVFEMRIYGLSVALSGAGIRQAVAIRGQGPYGYLETVSKIPHDRIRESFQSSFFYRAQDCFIRFRNSLRVLAEERNAPEKAEVVVTAFDFCTPLICMHVCIASMTTATPRG